MAIQQPLFPDEPTTPAARPRPSADSLPVPVWLQRMNIFTLVMFCLFIGIILAVIPWSTRCWDNNNVLLANPTLSHWLRQGWVRGVVSGLGLLDIWLGLSEAFHYRDYRG